MMVKFVGGPIDGQIWEVQDHFTSFSVAESDAWPSRYPVAEEIPIREVNYHPTPWTRDGCRLFVVEGYDRSLIDDEEILLASTWLAERQSEYDPPELRVNRKNLIASRTERFCADLLQARNRVGPDHVLGFSVAADSLHHFTVTIVPGKAEGFRNDETKPRWRWPTTPAAAPVEK